MYFSDEKLAAEAKKRWAEANADDAVALEVADVITTNFKLDGKPSPPPTVGLRTMEDASKHGGHIIDGSQTCDCAGNVRPRLHLRDHKMNEHTSDTIIMFKLKADVPWDKPTTDRVRAFAEGMEKDHPKIKGISFFKSDAGYEIKQVPA